MFFYKKDEKVLFSKTEYNNLESITESEAEKTSGRIFFLQSLSKNEAKRRFVVSHNSQLNGEVFGIEYLRQKDDYSIPSFINDKISCSQVVLINTSYTDWEKSLLCEEIKKWRINIAGLGDVGGTLLTGLRLIGGQYISKIGIYDLDMNRMKRWEYEANQIWGVNYNEMPEVFLLDEENLFDCDMFVFCVTKGVPSLDSNVSDVRLWQFNSNASLSVLYAKKALEKKYSGTFAVVSDPVDLLCRSVYDCLLGFLPPENVFGYGLGVMNARALYFSKKSKDIKERLYIDEGRAYGPHGQGLIIANSIFNYDHESSMSLTKSTINANIDVRNTGFKPYIAPALSSGAISIVDTISGAWHYSSVYLGGVFFGCRNRLTKYGLQIESLNICDELFLRIKKSYKDLGDIYEELVYNKTS